MRSSAPPRPESGLYRSITTRFAFGAASLSRSSTSVRFPFSVPSISWNRPWHSSASGSSTHGESAVASASTSFPPISTVIISALSSEEDASSCRSRISSRARSSCPPGSRRSELVAPGRPRVPVPLPAPERAVGESDVATAGRVRRADAERERIADGDVCGRLLGGGGSRRQEGQRHKRRQKRQQPSHESCYGDLTGGRPAGLPASHRSTVRSGGGGRGSKRDH